MFFVSFRSFAENLHHPCVLILAIPENRDPSYNMNEHSEWVELSMNIHEGKD